MRPQRRFETGRPHIDADMLQGRKANPAPHRMKGAGSLWKRRNPSALNRRRGGWAVTRQG